MCLLSDIRKKDVQNGLAGFQLLDTKNGRFTEHPSSLWIRQDEAAALLYIYLFTYLLTYLLIYLFS